MLPEEPKFPNKGLSIRRNGELVILPNGKSSVLSEIINRSHADIQTSKNWATSRRRAGEEREFEIRPGLTIVMCWVPPGRFLMGSPEEEENRCEDETQHPVVISNGFWLARKKISQRLWTAVMGNNPSFLVDDARPVEQVSWRDICGSDSDSLGFLERINRFAPSGMRFSLPTESEWEYACRAGTSEVYSEPFEGVVTERAAAESRIFHEGPEYTNSWGLCGMHGDIWEWCVDWHDLYPSDLAVDPSGPKTGMKKMVRGGKWKSYGGYCRAADRGRYGDLAETRPYIGFRLALKTIL